MKNTIYIDYTEKYRQNDGIILIDIILALTLATIFIAVMTTESMSARTIFDRVLDHEDFLESFEMSASSSQLGGTQDYISSSSRSFGNDLIQVDESGFTRVNLSDGANISDNKSVPFCSVDFFNHKSIGSYGFSSYGFGQPAEPPENMSQGIKITPISLPIDASLPLTDFQIRDDVAYISVDSVIASDPDLLVIDFHDLNDPKLISFINTGPGISSITLADNYIYAATPSTAGQLQIIQLNSFVNNTEQIRLTLKNKYKLALPLASTTPTKGSSIFYYKDKVYLGTEKWDGDELSVIDVTDQMNPYKIGGFETGGKIKNIFINDDMAYLAGADLQQLRILDISNPASPILLSSFSPSGSARQEGNAISIFEGRLGFGRTSGGFNIVTDPEFFNFDLFGTSAYTSSHILASSSSIDIPGGVYGIVEDRSHIFLATRQLNKEFQIYDLPVSTSFISTSTMRFYSLPVAPQKMTCDGDHIYILSATAPVIYEISFN